MPCTAKAWTVHRRKPIGSKRDGAALKRELRDVALAGSTRPLQQQHRYNWHWFWDYGTGELGNWGCHMLDVAAGDWASNCPHSVSAVGGQLPLQRRPRAWLPRQFVRISRRTVSFGSTGSWARTASGARPAAAFYGDGRSALVIDRQAGRSTTRARRSRRTPANRRLPTCRNFVDHQEPLGLGQHRNPERISPAAYMSPGQHRLCPSVAGVALDRPRAQLRAITRCRPAALAGHAGLDAADEC